MNQIDFYHLIVKSFPHRPTSKQDIALQMLAEFLVSKNQDEVFLLKGYAGTGKTSIVGALVENFPKIRKKSVLLAPTGRAAKVISNYSGRPAYTVHKQIYFPKNKQGGIAFTLKKNKHKNTVFIVDEASMIPDINQSSSLFENSSLLNDLMKYVYSGENCKVLFIGDTAQLPPVHLNISPALDSRILRNNFDKNVFQIELDEVVRQESDSGILINATRIRESLNDGFYKDFQFSGITFPDVIRPSDGQEIMDAISDSYAALGNEGSVIVVRSNKRANLYNQNIRQRILFQEAELSAGDYLMVVKNNYFWVDDKSEAGFIANGDIIEVLEIFAFRDLYGFRFAEVKIRMVDYPNMKPFETVLILNTLTSERASLSYEESNQLYQEVMKDYVSERSKYRKYLKVKNNKYFNALQVKFSYAITCHKSQGGQWHTVFVEQPYLPEGIGLEYLRWLYTAITRAEKKLYLIGFPEEFFAG